MKKKNNSMNIRTGDLLHHISDTQFLVLAIDESHYNGYDIFPGYHLNSNRSEHDYLVDKFIKIGNIKNIKIIKLLYAK